MLDPSLFVRDDDGEDDDDGDDDDDDDDDDDEDDDDDDGRKKEGVGANAPPRGRRRGGGGGGGSIRCEEAMRTLIELGPSYAVSLLHSLYAAIRGTMHLIHLWDASARDKLIIPGGITAAMGMGTGMGIADPPPSSIRWAHLLVAETNTFFLSYLLYDLCHVLHRYPRLGGVDTVLHHALFAVCALVNGTYGLMAFAFGWLSLGEGSTIFLNLRWFAIKSGRGDRPILETINVLFAITFFYVRIGVYTAGVVHLLFLPQCRDVLSSMPEWTGVPAPLLGLTCGCILLGWVLNLMWGFKIMAMVGGRGREGRGGGGDKKKKKKRQ